MRHIIRFPHNLGQKLKGVEKGAEMYTKHLVKNYPGKFLIKQVDCININNNDHFFENIRNLYKANQDLGAQQFRNLYKAGQDMGSKQFRMNIGGDHSMSLATVAYTLNCFPDCKVIWVDAHADINTYEASESKNFHGMPLAYLTGLDSHTELSFIKNYLPFDRLFYVGLRSLDYFEKELIYKHNIKYFLSQDINANPMGCYNILNKFLGDSPFHLSLDVDSFDPSVIPHTGTPVGYGINKSPGILLLHNLMKKKTLCNMDLTEINPHVNNRHLDDEELKYSVNNMFFTIDDIIKPIIN